LDGFSFRKYRGFRSVLSFWRRRLSCLGVSITFGYIYGINCARCCIMTKDILLVRLEGCDWESRCQVGREDSPDVTMSILIRELGS
jgi:hypothetical protein